jgi:hypothetical protein
MQFFALYKTRDKGNIPGNKTRITRIYIDTGYIRLIYGSYTGHIRDISTWDPKMTPPA